MAVDNHKCAVCVYLWFKRRSKQYRFRPIQRRITGWQHSREKSHLVWLHEHRFETSHTNQALSQPWEAVNQGNLDVTQSLTRLHQVRYTRQMNRKKKVEYGDGTLLPRHLPGGTEKLRRTLVRIAVSSGSRFTLGMLRLRMRSADHSTATVSKIEPCRRWWLLSSALNYGKSVPVYDMEQYRQNNITAPFIHIHGIRRMSVVSSMSRP